MYFYKNCVFATFFHRPSTTNQGLKTVSDFAVNQYQLATDDCSGVNNWKKFQFIAVTLHCVAIR